MYGFPIISPSLMSSMQGVKLESIFGLIGFFTISLIIFIGIYKTACYIRDKKWN